MADTHFLVERFNWRRADRAFYRVPGAVTVIACDTFEEADAFCAFEEDRARQLVNPFARGLLAPFDQTHWQPDVLCDYLFEKGIDPPPLVAGKRDWPGWWARHASGWTADQRKLVWEPLDKVRFFQVREAPRRPLAYAVVGLSWSYCDYWESPDAEGGELHTTLYRRREAAEAEARRLTDEVMTNGLQQGDEWDGIIPPDSIPYRLPPDHDPFAPESDEPPAGGLFRSSTYEVVAVELGGDV